MIVLIVLSLLHLIEAWLEVSVIRLKNPYVDKYNLYNKQEHFRSAVFAACLLATASAVSVHFYNDLWVLPALVVNRRIFFDYVLVIWMDWKYYAYTGDGWWDKLFKWIFGLNGRLKELASTILITIFYIIQNFFS